jgi:hypothetical protein
MLPSSCMRPDLPLQLCHLQLIQRQYPEFRRSRSYQSGLTGPRSCLSLTVVAETLSRSLAGIHWACTDQDRGEADAKLTSRSGGDSGSDRWCFDRPHGVALSIILAYALSCLIWNMLILLVLARRTGTALRVAVDRVRQCPLAGS